jgi:hypothetical protein
MRNNSSYEYDDYSRGEKRRRSRSSSRDRDKRLHSSASVYRDDYRSQAMAHDNRDKTADRAWENNDHRRDYNRQTNEKWNDRYDSRADSRSGFDHEHSNRSEAHRGYQDQRDRDNLHERERSEASAATTTTKIIIKGLPSHTTEASVTYSNILPKSEI